MNFKRYHVSRNLYNRQYMFAYIDSTGKIIENTANVLAYTEVEPNTTYTVSADLMATSGNRIAVFNTAPTANLTGSNVISISQRAYLFTITTNNDTKYIAWHTSLSDTNRLSQFVRTSMLNTGSTALPYEPYSSEVWHDIPHYIHNTSTDTITTLPAVLYPNAATATVGLKGNMYQASGVSPTIPIQPQETGERTRNLFDKDNVVFSGFYPHADTGAVVNTTSGKLLSIIVPCEPNTSYTWSFDRIVADLRNRVAGYSAYPTVNMACTFLDKETDPQPGSTRAIQKFTTTADTHWLILMVTGTGKTAETLTEDVADNAQLEISTEMTSYEPYGIKIPILCGNTTTNVYLSEVESTRNIKKVIFKGSENWTLVSGTHGFYTQIGDALDKGAAYIISSHYRASTDSTDGAIRIANNKREVLLFDNYASAAEYKAFLAQQYSAGTPVTIWYVLAEPTTGIVNEPLRKIGDYADSVSVTNIPTTAGSQTFDVDTTLKPSEVELTYTGWHDASAKEWDGSEWQ